MNFQTSVYFIGTFIGAPTGLADRTFPKRRSPDQRI